MVSLLVALFALTLVSALPTRDGSSGHYVPSAYVLPLERHPLELATNLKHRQVDTIFENRAEILYTVPVGVGGKTFTLLVDTGSSHTWVAESNYTCQTLSGEACYVGHDLSVSNTEKWISPLVATYGDESHPSGATGGLVRRPVTIAGITIKDQIIGVADTIRGNTFDGSYDGFLGLGQRPGTSNGQTPEYNPVFVSMVNEGLLHTNSFSILLNGTADLTTPDNGLLAFGGYSDSINLMSQRARAPILTGNWSQWYTIQVDRFWFPGASEVELTQYERVAVVDSGVTYTQLTPKIAQKIFDLMPGEYSSKCKGNITEKCVLNSGIWKFPCTGTVPSFAIEIGGVRFPFTPDNLIVSVPGEKYCYGGVMAATGAIPNILGFSWMKNYVVVLHNYEDPENPFLEVATYEFV